MSDLAKTLEWLEALGFKQVVKPAHQLKSFEYTVDNDIICMSVVNPRAIKKDFTCYRFIFSMREQKLLSHCLV